MAAASTNPPAAVKLAENIALLHLLHEVPVSPTPIDDANTHGLDDDGAETRSLPIERERSLAGALALLSSIRDDTNRITAVALQEDRQAGGLQVLIAVNQSADPKRVFLDKIGTGFKRIFGALSRASHAPDPKLEEKILHAVVAMCRERILSRLHLKRGKWARHNPNKSMLERVRRVSEPVQAHMAQLRQCGLEQSAQAFLRASKGFVDQLKVYKKHTTDEGLVQIVKEASQWTRAGDVTNIFKRIPSRAPNADEAKALMDTVSKVGQYQSAACHLYRSARRFPVVRHMTPVPVILEPAALSKLPNGDYRPDLLATLSRIRRNPDQTHAMKQMCQILERNVKEARNTFESTVLASLREAKVHAEVQILAHLETLPLSGPAPRFVRSNKKACFLCNELLATQKRILTPHSHGRIYPGWRLPSLPALDGLHGRFNAALETWARKSLHQLLSTMKSVKHPYPNESGMLSAMRSATTASSAVPSPSSQEPDEFAHEMGPQQDATEDAVADESSSVISVASKEPSSDDEGASDIALIAERRLSGSLLPYHASPLYHAGMLDIQLEYEVVLNRDSSRHLTYEIKMLEGDEARIIRENPATVAYDALCMDPGSQVDVSRREPIYIALRDCLVQLSLRT